MKRRTLHWNVVGDDGGQAMTEFVIVIPIVLMFFLAMVQYFYIVQASQLGNYAAFVAARAYAVSGHDSDPLDEATTAACIALAPIARPMPGEIGGNTAFGSFANSIISTISSIASSSTLGQDIYNFGSGYAMAKYVRLKSSILGGSITATKQGTPAQVDVTINYPQPIFIPGLSGMWNFVTGTRIYAGMKPLRQGLTGITSDILPVYEGADALQGFAQQLAQFDPGAASSLNQFVSSLPVIMLPYVNVQSKCSLGYSDWSGVPRLKDTTDDNSQTNQPAATGQASAIQQTQKDQKTYQDDANAASTACSNLGTANANLTAAQNNYNSVMNNKNSTAQQKADAQTQLSQAQTAQSSAETANSNAQSKVNDSAATVNNDYSQLGQTTQVKGVDCPNN